MQEGERQFSVKRYFLPFTTIKAIHFIVIIGFIVFANCLFNSFVWDDNSYIINNAGFQRLGFLGLFQGNDFNATSQYRPIPALYFSMLYHLFTTAPFFYHFMQILLHSACAILVFLFFKRFFSKKISFFLSLVFLVHPIQVESVSFIGATGNILFFLFGMIALLLSLHYRKSKISLMLIFFFLLLSFLSKETGFLFLLIILLVVFLYQRRSFLLFLICGALTSGLYFLIRFDIGGVFFKKIPFVAIHDLTFSQRLLNIPAIIFYYLKTFSLPLNLVIDQQWIVKNINFQHFWMPLFADILFFTAIGSLGIYFYSGNKKRFHIFLIFFLWFTAGLFMHLQIFPLDMTVADRWFYFPIVGVLGMLGLFIELVSKKITTKVLILIGVLIVLPLSYRTILRNFDLKDDITLASHDVKGAENPYDLENNLSFAYIQVGQCKEAKLYAVKSIQLYPTFDNYINLGVSSYCLGEYKQAKDAYMDALHIADNHQAYERLANLALTYGDSQKNIDFIKNVALKKNPSDILLWVDLAILEYTQGNTDNAKAEIARAYAYDSGPQVKSVYTSIMNNQRIDVNVKFGK